MIAQTVVNAWSLISMMYWTTTAVAMTAVVMMIAAAALIKKRNPVLVVAAVITNSIFIDYLVRTPTFGISKYWCSFLFLRIFCL